MLTCKDCMHYDVCGKKSMWENVLQISNDNCENFKDNSRYKGSHRHCWTPLNLPTEDVISVVRCRNCQYHHWEQEPSHGKAAHFCNLLKREVNKDFYCASGSLKD